MTDSESVKEIKAMSEKKAANSSNPPNVPQVAETETPTFRSSLSSADRERVEEIRGRAESSERRVGATYSDSLRHSPMFVQMAVHEAELELLRGANVDIPFLLSLVSRLEARVGVLEGALGHLLSAFEQVSRDAPSGLVPVIIAEARAALSTDTGEET